MIPLTEERKQQIIDEQPGGLWLVLEEEYPREAPEPGDLLCEDLGEADDQPAAADTNRRPAVVSSAKAPGVS